MMGLKVLMIDDICHETMLTTVDGVMGDDLLTSCILVGSVLSRYGTAYCEHLMGVQS